jgi:hypothetical protein
LPDDSMVDQTLMMDLEITGPAGFQRTERLVTAGGYGYLRDLLAGAGEASAAVASVTVVRDLGAFFDDVDFATLSEVDTGRALLAAIGAATRVTVVTEDWQADDLSGQVAP